MACVVGVDSGYAVYAVYAVCEEDVMYWRLDDGFGESF